MTRCQRVRIISCLLSHARARDWHRAIESDKDKILIPSSMIQAEWKRKSGNKRKSAGKFLCCLCFWPVLVLASACSRVSCCLVFSFFLLLFSLAPKIPLCLVRQMRRGLFHHQLGKQGSQRSSTMPPFLALQISFWQQRQRWWPQTNQRYR
jgi:hypothetical protein